MKKKILVQFDGSNFYNKVKRIDGNAHLTTLNYKGLVKSITKTTPSKVVYYTGEIRQFEGNKKSESLYAGQQKLFTHLRNQNIEIKLGYLLMSDGKFHEKGVDVQIAVDIVRGAIKNEKEEGKEIVYVGFENFISQALSRNCSSYLVLEKSQILEFAKDKQI